VVIVTEPGTSGLPFRSYLEPEDVHLNIDPATTLRPPGLSPDALFS
jgi:hypothetical protein